MQHPSVHCNYLFCNVDFVKRFGVIPKKGINVTLPDFHLAEIYAELCIKVPEKNFLQHFLFLLEIQQIHGQPPNAPEIHSPGFRIFSFWQVRGNSRMGLGGREKYSRNSGDCFFVHLRFYSIMSYSRWNVKYTHFLNILSQPLVFWHRLDQPILYAPLFLLCFNEVVFCLNLNAVVLLKRLICLNSFDELLKWPRCYSLFFIAPTSRCCVTNIFGLCFY